MLLSNISSLPSLPSFNINDKGVGLLGCGTVGSAVAELLMRYYPGLLRGIAVRDIHKKRNIAWSDYTQDPFDIVDDPHNRVIIECIGGLGLARELVIRAIARGKHVVTANKDLMASEGPWLLEFAQKTGGSLRYEAAVGGAIPIIHSLCTSLKYEDISRIGGVLNGTTNFILDAMFEGQSYADALLQAQQLGFAENEPSADVDGHDAAHKIAILAGLAFHQPCLSSSIERFGIGNICLEDIAFAKQNNLVIKLLAIAQKKEDIIYIGVMPAYVKNTHPFSQPHGAENIIEVSGKLCGKLYFSGLGAGGHPTASSILGDVMAAVHNVKMPVCNNYSQSSFEPLCVSVLVRDFFGKHTIIHNISIDYIESLKNNMQAESVIPIWEDISL